MSIIDLQELAVLRRKTIRDAHAKMLLFEETGDVTDFSLPGERHGTLALPGSGFENWAKRRFESRNPLCELSKG